MLLGLLFIVGCLNSLEDTLRTNVDIDEVDEVDSNVPIANNDFGFNLINSIWQTEQNQNIFISPFSISIALTMTLNGAANQTEQAMIDTLQLQDVGIDSINSSYAQLLQTHETSDPKVTLTIANSLWGRRGVEFNAVFLQRNSEYFNAEISTLDFLDPNAVKTINQWVDTNTDGKIPKILDEIDSNAVLFLINAIYFKGSWQSEFDPSKTRERTFHLPTGSEKQVPMMERKGNYPYFQDQNLQAINLPYGEGQMSMYIFLPSNKSNLHTFMEGINTTNLDHWITQFREQEITVNIPKFKMEYSIKELKDILTTLGMGIAFDEDRADFSRMADLEKVGGNLYIAKVAHKTFIEVNEEGTEAAAATSVGVGVKSLPLRFIANRPFFIAIRDNETKTVIFMGTVVDP